MTGTLRAVRGMNDLFEDELVTWRHVEDAARSLFLAYGFGEIRTPVVEDTELYVRGVGEGTDIVGKEMFRVSKAGDDESLALRPEGTAGVVRAMIEAGKLMPDAYYKVFYAGPMFRAERPAKGRYRQFHQLGAEVLGYAEPAADVEVIAAVHALLMRLGIPAQLLLSSLGDAGPDRVKYNDALRAYFAGHESALSDDSKRRLQQNPLRILDSKDEGDQLLVVDAPKPLDFLSDAARAHFDAVKAGLEAQSIPFTIEPKIVRGLDYYTRTVFEFVGEAGLGAQSTVAAGGRYDGLVQELGGRPTPAVGFAAGIERLILVMNATGHKQEKTPPALALIGADDAGRLLCHKLASALRSRGVVVDVDLRARSVGALMRAANKSGARFTVTIGSSEIASGSMSLKTMATGAVVTMPIDADDLSRAIGVEVP
ncbi:MAG TPA: histidine--tRNA ligase [Myxococcota bacterium]